MGDILTILLIVAAVKFVIIAVILWAVFRPNLRSLFAKPEPPPVPVCLYCGSKWTNLVDDGEIQWDGDELILVTTYECEHCHFPIRHVERVPAGTVQR